ncbi:FCH and double SH3 domain protein 2 [Cricetulus griseus]|nr:FCH and double SH3 domain protein 2 [Cricetulus griseus]
MYPVWKSFLEGTMQVAQSRINICENYKNFISEPARTVRSLKEQQLKRCVDQLTKIQTELQETVKDLAKGKKKYFETEQMAHAVREKADIEAKSKLSLFQSRISLQKASVKLKARRSECNSKATHARNDYLLTLAAANAHQDRYYQTDLVNIMKALDGNVYDHLKDYLIAFSRTELETCQAIQNTFQFLLENSSKVVRDYNLQLFLQENAVFHKPQPFQFQPCDSDTSRQLESETGTTEEHSLNKEARKWATRVAREHKNIVHHQRVLNDLECHGVAVSEQSRAELEQKIDEARENIRKAEIIKLKAEARLDLLKQIGVSVDTWLKSAMNQVMEELENERWARPPVITSNGTLHSLNTDAEREEEEFEDNMDVFDDSSSSPSGTLRNYPLTCKVVYSYKASQPDELTIEEHEVLEVIEDGDMEDWVKARNKVGQVGYVPEKYLQFPTSNSLLSMLQSLAALDSRSHTSSNSTEAELISGSLNGDASVCFVKALYDYEGQTDDELSFPEGAIIRIVNKENQDDDGFWEGEFNGRIGVFPSVLVEELSASENGDTPGTREIQKTAFMLNHQGSHKHQGRLSTPHMASCGLFERHPHHPHRTTDGQLRKWRMWRSHWCDKQLSPSASAASGPAALTFVWGEEPVGPGGNLLSVEQIKDCTPTQVKPRRPDLQVVGEPCAVAYGTAAGLKGCPHWTVGLLDLGNKVMFANSLYLGWGMKFTDLKVVQCFEISISPENL